MKELEVITPADLEDDYSNDDLFNISSWGADLSFREIISMYTDNELIKPELQRNYVWDRAEASRFIESLLLGLPVPSIFLAKTVDELYLIIDGYQRIMTVYDFTRGIFGKDGKAFKLTNTKKINERWRGRTFLELDEKDQRKLRNTTIHAIIFEQKQPKDDDTSLYQVFERINTSGRSLFPQEIRNCVYQGNLNKLLISLNTNPTWRALLHLESPDDRMRDMEYILRALYYINTDFTKKDVKQILLKKELNDFMANDDNNSNEKIELFKMQFTETIIFIYENIGINAFNTIDSKGSFIEKFHPALADSVFYASYHLKSERTNSLKTKYLKIIKDPAFEKAITERTTNIETINRKNELMLNGLK